MFLHVLESQASAGRHYTGLSSDPVRRLDWHNAGLSIHTRKFRPWELLVSIEFADTSTATRFERYLKDRLGSRVRKASFFGVMAMIFASNNDL
jgi:putative endonuclease